MELKCIGLGKQKFHHFPVQFRFCVAVCLTVRVNYSKHSLLKKHAQELQLTALTKQSFRERQFYSSLLS